ncbi:MAG: hypothetical protein ABI220_04235 [Candidatus Saccharimonadales bacterium]
MKRLNSRGQTLIALLIFMMVAMMITLAATAVAIINLKAGNSYASGQQALINADSGAENALMRLSRDPAYSGETMTLGSGTATISVSGTDTRNVVSVGTDKNASRTITVTASDTNNQLTVLSWSETP